MTNNNTRLQDRAKQITAEIAREYGVYVDAKEVAIVAAVLKRRRGRAA